MGSDAVIMRRDERTLHHGNLTSTTNKQNNEKMTFSTPYKMRKFSEDTVTSTVDSPRNALLLPASTNITANQTASGRQDGMLNHPSSPSTPLSYDGSGTAAVAGHGHRPATTPQQQQPPSPQEAGIPIPAFMQPLLGLEFVPFVMPSVDETTISTYEALTDKLLEELDVAGCPTYGGSSSNGTSCGNHQTEVSPLPASTTPLNTLDTPPTSQLMLTNLKDVEKDEGAKTTALSPRHGRETEAMQPEEQHVDVESLKRKEEPERRRNIFQRRRIHSFGSSLNDNNIHPNITSTKSSKAATPTPRRKTRLRFLKKKNRKEGRDKDSKETDRSLESYDDATLGCDRVPMEWLETQQSLLQRHQSTLQAVQTEAAEMQHKSIVIGQRVHGLQSEIAQLQKALERSQNDLRTEVNNFDHTRSRLEHLRQSAIEASQAVTATLQQMKLGPSKSGAPSTPVRSNNNRNDMMDHDGPTVEFRPAPSPPRQRAVTAPTNAEVYMDDAGLDLYTSTTNSNSNDASSTVSSISNLNLDTLPSANEFVFVDHNLKSILHNLDQLGYDVATDESDRFVATRDTEKALKLYNKNPQSHDSIIINDSWPIQPWYSVHGEDILIWTGDVRHDGLGSDWPVCKARGLVNTSPRELLEYLKDSSKVKEYNKISQGREDMYKIQEGIDVPESQSSYGIAGDCKIVKAVNKPRLIPITIEMISLMHCKPLEALPGSYMMVYRSVFEDNTASGDETPVIRSEMLLGAVLVRPYNDDHTVCEMTSVTHMYSPGVPEMIARRAAPSSAMNMIKDIQSVFKKD